MPGEDKISALHKAASEHFDVGTIDEFKTKLQDPAKRKAFYEAANKEFDLGDYKSFEEKVALKKKEPTVSPSVLPSTQEVGNVPLASEDGTLESAAIPSVLQRPTPKQPIPQNQGFEQLASQIGQPQKIQQTSITANQPVQPLMGAATSPLSTPIDISQEVKSDATGNLESKDLGKAVTAGAANLGSMLMRTPAYLYDVAASPFNYMASGRLKEDLGVLPNIGESKILQEATGINNNPISSQDPNNALAPAFNKLEQGAQYYDEQVKALHKDIQEKYIGSITSEIEKGDYTKAISKIAMGIAESAPATIGLAAAGAAGVGTAASILGGGSVFAAGKKAELDQNNPDMSEHQKLGVATLNGLFEGLGEQIGITQLGQITKKVLTKSGEEAAREIAEKGFKDIYGPILKKYLGVSANEAIGEGATQFAQNAVDKFGGVNPDLKLTEGMVDAMLVGFGASVGPSTLVGAMDVAKTKKAAKRAGEIIDHKKTLESELQSESVAPETKKIISDKIKDLNIEDSNLHAEEKKNYDELPATKQKEVDGHLEEVNKLADALSDPSITDETRDIIKAEIDKSETKIEEVFDENKKELEKLAKENGKKEEENKASNDEWMKSFKEKVIAGKKAKQDAEKVAANVETGKETTSETPESTQPIKTEDNATKEGVVTKGDISKHPQGSEIGSSAETSGSDSAKQSREVQKEVTPKVEPVKVPKTNKTETNGQETIKTEQAGKTEQADEAKVLETEAAGKKPAAKQELIDEEDQTEEQKTNNPDAIQKLNDDIEVLKKFDKANIASTKFKAILARAWKMKEEGKISKPTYTKYRNIAQQVLGPKVSVDSEKAKFHVEQLKEEVKKKLLGEGYKKVIMSAPGFGPKQVADLIDLTAKAANIAIDAGFTVKEAIESAIEHIKEHKNYSKLIEEGHLKEKEFAKAVNESFSKVEEPVVETPVVETPVKEEKKVSATSNRKQTNRILESDFVDPEIKEGLVKDGYNYIPRKINMAQQDARNVVKFYDEGGKIDDLIEKVMTDKDLGRVERNTLAATIFEHVNKQAGKETDVESKNELRNKAIKVHQFLAKNLTDSAQDLRINGTINKSIANGDPDVAVTLLKEQAQKNINEKFSGKKEDKVINEAVNDINKIEEEINKRVNEKVGQEVEKEIEARILKIIPKETVDKISNFFDRMMIKANGKLFSDVTGLGGLTTAVWNGSLTVVKASIKLGIIAYNGIANSAMINNAITDGINYIKEQSDEPFDEKAYRERVSEDITSGLKEAGIEVRDKKARKKEIIDTVNEAVNEINNGKKEKAPKEKTVNENKQKDIEKAKALLEGSIGNLKMSEYAKNKLTADVIEHLENNEGKITKQEFKNMYADALGYDFVTPEAEADIKSNFEEIHKAEALKDELESTLNEAVKKEKEYKADGKKMPSDESKTYIDKINELRQGLNKQTMVAQRANDKISEHFREGKNFYRMLGGMLQGNLLTPLSQIVNIVSYAPTLSARFATGLGATILDIGESALARTGLFDKKLNKNLQTNIFAEAAYGAKYGVMPGLKESLFKLRTGQLSEDATIRDASQKFNAFDSLHDFWTSRKGKDFETNLTNFVEGHFGIPADIMFRLLGPADIIIRKSKEYGILAEKAKAQGLEGFEFMREVLNPKEENLEEAQKASLKASYQNDNIITKTISDFEKSAGKFIEKLAGEKMAYHINGTVNLLKTGVIPFTKTPLNIIGELIQYTAPVIPFAKAMISLKQGNRKDFNVNFSKAVVGAGFSYIASQLVMNGLMTGGPDDEEKDKEKRAMYENVGYKKLNWSALSRMAQGDEKWSSIRDNDTWINYDKMGLPGMILGTWANHYKDMKRQDIRDQNVMSQMILGMPATFKAALEGSFLQGTNKAMEAIMNPEGKRAKYFVVGYAGSLASIAYPNTISNISKSTDPFIRDKRTDEGLMKMLVNDFKVKMFKGDDLPSRVTLWGQDAKSVPAGTNPYAYYLLDPIKSKDISTQTFGYKIFDFWKKTEDEDMKIKILPSPPKKDLALKGQKVTLTDSEYNQFQKLVGQGRAAEAEAYVTSGDFDTDNDNKKVEKLQQIYRDAYNNAKAIFIENTPRLQEMEWVDDE